MPITKPRPSKFGACQPGAAMGIIGKAILFTAMIGAPTLAADPCANPPPVVLDYLAAHPGWRIVRRVDLIRDDQELWAQAYRERCPGLATVDFDGTGRPHIGLALLGTINGKRHEQVVVIRRSGKNIEQHVLSAPFAIGRADVIYTVPPGVAKQWDGPKQVTLKQESLVYEHMESAAIQYYFAKGKFRSIQISD